MPLMDRRFLSFKRRSPPPQGQDGTQRQNNGLGSLLDFEVGEARDLVVEGELPITHISASVGYRHLPTFINAFTQRFGVSPRRLRGDVQYESSATILGGNG